MNPCTLRHAGGTWVPMHKIISEYKPGEGRHWFDRDTLRFFACRLPGGGFRAPDGRVLFVSSEKAPHGTRRYTLRVMTASGIDTVGEFQSYATRAQAYGAMVRELRATKEEA